MAIELSEKMVQVRCEVCGRKVKLHAQFGQSWPKSHGVPTTLSRRGGKTMIAQLRSKILAWNTRATSLEEGQDE